VESSQGLEITDFYWRLRVYFSLNISWENINRKIIIKNTSKNLNTSRIVSTVLIYFNINLTILHMFGLLNWGHCFIIILTKLYYRSNPKMWHFQSQKWVIVRGRRIVTRTRFRRTIPTQPCCMTSWCTENGLHNRTRNCCWRPRRPLRTEASLYYPPAMGGKTGSFLGSSGRVWPVRGISFSINR